MKIKVTPKDRAMPREAYKYLDRLCRCIARDQGEAIEKAAKEMMSDMLIYGSTMPIEAYLPDGLPPLSRPL